MSREATIADIPALIPWGREFHEASNQAFPFDPEGLDRTLRGMIEAEAATVIMHDHGVIGGILSPVYCAPAWVMAVELFWWAEKDGMQLLRAFEAWAEARGANEVRMTTLTNLPTADAILRRKGYAASEISYSKVI